MPGTRDFSDALFRRACILTFNNQFKGVNCDPQLIQKLSGERSGILNMALEAFRGVIEQGVFTEPSSMVAALQKWRLDADQVRQFVEECCILGEGEESKSVVYEAYQSFAKINGISPSRTLSHKSFSNRLSSLDVGERRDNHTRYYTGLQLKEVKWDFPGFTK